MSREILARSGAYTLTEFAGPNGQKMMQILVPHHFANDTRGGYIQLPADCLETLAQDLIDYLQSNKPQNTFGRL